MNFESFRIAEFYELCTQISAPNNTEISSQVNELHNRLDIIHEIELDTLIDLMSCLATLNDSNETTSVSIALLILEIHLKCRQVCVVNALEAASSVFMQQTRLSNSEMSNLVPQCAQIWISLAKDMRLHEFICYFLITASFNYNFGRENEVNDPVLSRLCTKLSSACLQTVPSNRRTDIINELISIWSNSRFKGKELAEQLMDITLVIGSLNLSDFIAATELKSTKNLEILAHQSLKNSQQLSNLICRSIILRAKESKPANLDSLDLDGFTKCLCKNWRNLDFPSAELVLSSFVVNLVKLLGVLNSLKYPGLAFKLLRLAYPYLYEVQLCSRGGIQETQGEEDREDDGMTENDTQRSTLVPISVINVLENCTSIDAKLFIASKQVIYTPEYHYDLTLKLKNTHKTNSNNENSLGMYISQLPVSKLYMKLQQLFRLMANNELLKDNFQIELFQMLEKIDFPLFEMHWLNRLVNSPPQVCESLVTLSLKSHKNDPQQLSELFSKFSVKMMTPGNTNYKLKVLNSVPNFDFSSIWLCILYGISDLNVEVKKRAISVGIKLLNQEFWNGLLEICESNFTVSNATKTLFAEFNDLKVRTIINETLRKDLEVACLVIEARSNCFPVTKLGLVVDLMQQGFDNKSLTCLKILKAVLTAKPRFILPFKTVSMLFDFLVKYLKLASPEEFQYLVVILDCLAKLGSLQDQKMRERKLNLVLNVAMSKLDAESVQLRTQATLILSGYGHWPSPCISMDTITGTSKGTSTGTNMETGKQIVDKLCRQSLTAEPGSLYKQSIIITVFSITCKFPQLYNQQINELFISTHSNLIETKLFTKMVFLQLTQQDKPTRSESSTGHVAHAKDNIFGFHSSTPKLEFSILSSHLETVFLQILETNDLTCFQILVKAINERLVNASNCLPLLTALCLAPQSAISQSVYPIYCQLAKANVDILAHKFKQGVQLACKKFKSLNELMLPKLWDFNQRKLTKLIVYEFVNSMNPQLQSLKYMELGVNALQLTQFQVGEATEIIRILDTKTQSCSVHVSNEEAIGYVLLIVLSMYLKKKHGLSVYKGKSRQLDSRIVEGFSVKQVVAKLQNTDVTMQLTTLLDLPDDFDNEGVQNLVITESQSEIDNFERNFKKRRIS